MEHPAATGRLRLQALLVIALSLAAATASAEGPAGLTPEVRARIDAVAAKVLDETGVPSASVAVVKDGAICYVKAYGNARLSPRMPAVPSMRYCIGSISKQFAATVLVMLAEEGQLSLDDKVGKFLPELTWADEITVRQLLSHTAGIRDYWPQDYVPASMLQPITTQALMGQRARQPLDFEPGTRYQYSNTGYVVAGAIAERASGRPLIDLLRERIFTRLEMTSVVDVDQGRLESGDAQGYTRYGLGPPRMAPKEGKGWLFAAGELGMTAEDLARWDVSLIEGKLLSIAGYRELTTEVLLKNGAGTGYALGLDVKLESQRRLLAHDGEVSGFVAANRVYPEERVAVVVLTNQDASSAAGTLVQKIADLLFVAASPADSGKLAQVRAIFVDLQRGKIDRSLLSPNANAYFSAGALADFKASLGPLGSLKELEQKRQGLRGGLVTRVYRANLAKQTLEIVTRAMPDGRFEQYQVGVE
jgi:D-alanyl-D-alanine carboxypeptidase